MSMAAMVATNVAIMQGIKMSVGFAAAGLTAALAAMMLTGMSVKPEACKQRNMICALEALSLLGLISWRLCMAFRPKGVAALSRPIRLAEKFIIMWPMAGWFFGNSGNNLEKKGPIIFESTLIPPALSAILIKPINSPIMPMSPIAIVTAVLQVSIMPSAF